MRSGLHLRTHRVQGSGRKVRRSTSLSGVPIVCERAERKRRTGGCLICQCTCTIGRSTNEPELLLQRPTHTMSSSLGVPPKLLNEAFGHVITVELKNGQLFRGKLLDGASI